MVRTSAGIALSGVHVQLTPIEGGAPAGGDSGRDGIVRITRIVPGRYQVTFQSPELCLAQNDVTFNAGEVVVVEATLQPKVADAPNERKVPEQGVTPVEEATGWQELFRRPVEAMLAQL